MARKYKTAPLRPVTIDVPAGQEKIAQHKTNNWTYT